MNLIRDSHKNEWGEQAGCSLSCCSTSTTNRKLPAKKTENFLLIQITLNLLLASRLPKYWLIMPSKFPLFHAPDINLLGAHNMYLSIFEEFLKNGGRIFLLSYLRQVGVGFAVSPTLVDFTNSNLERKISPATFHQIHTREKAREKWKSLWIYSLWSSWICFHLPASYDCEDAVECMRMKKSVVIDDCWGFFFLNDVEEQVWLWT